MPKILVVDDDQDMRTAIRTLLERRYEVLDVADGLQALKLIPQFQPRLLLLDMSMPGMSGLEVLAEARKIDPALRVLMLTGQQDVALAKQCLELGAKAFITKPFEPNDLNAQLESLLAPPDPDARPWRVEE